MVQSSNRFCASCGTALEAEQRFCPNCGNAVEAPTSSPTSRSTPEETTSAVPQLGMSGSNPDYNSPTVATPPVPESGAFNTPPPPPPDQSSMPSYPPPPPPSDPYPSYNQSSASYPGIGYPSTGQPTPGGYGVPDFARPQPNKNRTGLIIGIVAVVVVLIVGGVIVLPGMFKNNTRTTTQATSTSVAQTQSTPSDNATTTSDATPTTSSTSSQPKTVTFAKPLAFTYASVDISVISAQQAKTFSDDSAYYSQSNSGILRLNIKESSNDPNNSFSSYYPTSDMMIVKPDGTTSKAESAQTDESVNNGVSRQNWVDFAVPMSIDVSKLVLRVGSSGEEQVQVPLKDGADLSKYQPKTSALNKSTTFGNMTWTIEQGTLSLSYGGNQAKKGQVYITLKFKVVNNGTSPAIKSPYDYLRMKSGDNTYQVKDPLDMPVSFEAGSTAEYSSVFLVPASADGNYAFQLLGLNDSYWPPPSSTASIDFQLK